MKKEIFSLWLVLGLLISSPHANAGIKSFCSSILRLNQKKEDLQISPLQKDSVRFQQIRQLQGGEKKEAFRAYAIPDKKSIKQKAYVLANWSMATWMAVRIGFGLHNDPSDLIPALLTIPPALFTVDFVSQVFHKWFDSFADESSPLFGETARDFRRHHEYPSNLNEADYWSNAAAPAKFLFPTFIGASVMNTDPLVGSAVWFFLFSMMNVVEAHKQAHMSKPNWFFKFMQKYRITVPRDVHLSHHAPPFDATYAVFNGWSDPLNRRLKLWSRLDRIWWKVFKKLPNTWIQDPSSIPQDVVSELMGDLDNIPADLWAYGEAYPKRVPESVRENLLKAKEKWLSKYIEERQSKYREEAKQDPLATERWEAEQKTYPWIYGESLIPLD
jgi:hypothetical protein